MRDVAVQADVSGKHFTLEASALLGVGPQGGSHGSEARMTVTRDAAVVVQVESHLSTDGKIQVHLQVGAGFSGPKDYAFTVADQKTLQGTIDGKPIAPLPLGAKIESPRYADGTPIPATQLDNDIKEALPLLARMAQEECPKVAPPQGGGGAPAPAPVQGGDPPGHFSNPLGSGNCVACIAAVNGVLGGCVVATFVAASSCTVYYALCVAAGIATCFASEYLGLCTVCHDAEFSGCGGGGPCCLVDCVGDHCCDVGETCVGTAGLCCSPGFKGCGEGNCCSPTETCMGNGTCCPSTAACGGACCAADQDCINSATSTCCSKAHSCDGVCCAQNEICTNHVCAPCPNCGPTQECCAGQCCIGPQMFCDVDTKTCRCRPSCGGKCNGAPDGCGGTCTTSCAQRQVCVNQTCCTPNCLGKCGVSDGCGGTCSTDCGEGKFCKDNVCVSTCPPGRADCCGDGTCCLSSSGPDQCYKCTCGGQCTPQCAGKCGGAPDHCGGTCNTCGAGQVCQGQTCCTPNCAGKCGGAPDGCGGTCNTCEAGQVCRGQTCCRASCAGKCGGAPDGCGGTCTGPCPEGHTCKGKVCVSSCAEAGRDDCCGNGTCCMPSEQCYKCNCLRP